MFKDLSEGQTHYYGDGCPKHSKECHVCFGEGNFVVKLNGVVMMRQNECVACNGTGFQQETGNDGV